MSPDIKSTSSVFDIKPYDIDDPDEEPILPGFFLEDADSSPETIRAQRTEEDRRFWLNQMSADPDEAAVICGSWRRRSDPARRAVKIIPNAF